MSEQLSSTTVSQYGNYTIRAAGASPSIAHLKYMVVLNLIYVTWEERQFEDLAQAIK